VSAAATRGGRKLAAALARFGLHGRLRGVRALDIGAGFAAVLLAEGAAHVTAVRVGPGRLAGEPRADARVVSLEGTSFEDLPLGEAAGPFDFFAVDVSFATARSTLRGFASRLRPGAEGVILVPPQFELPPGRRRAADDPAARAAALARIRAKAAPLGFELLAEAPAPVAAGEGAGALLTHWRFAGRTAKLPARRPAGAAPAPAPGPSPAPERDWSLFAVVAPGLEEVVAEEVRRLPGAREVTRVAGGVTFAGPTELVWRANLGLRAATRVVVRLGEVEARDFSRLRYGLARLPWRRVADGPRAVKVSVAARHCRLYHTGAITENVLLGLADALRLRDPVAAAAPPLGVLVRGVDDRFTVSVDASGELLHRRGWRTEAGAAPLRETLAAGMLLLAGWDPRTPLVDPMCGSGTIVLEACSLARGAPPGAGRAFACAAWPGFDPARWDALVAALRAAAAARSPAPLAGYDHDPRVIAVARRNAERAGCAAGVTLAPLGLEAVAPPAGAGPGLLLCNPPYGRRLGRPAALRPLYTALGRVLRERFRGWRAGVLGADPALARALRLTPTAEHRLVNGGLPVTLSLFQL
jgi:putative N6-adenine-specific DNA methylase